MTSAEQLRFSQHKTLEQTLQAMVAQQDLSVERLKIKQWADQLGLDNLDLAAALLKLTVHQQASEADIDPPVRKRKSPQMRLVRYRLDVGSQHQISQQDIQQLLVQESGVEHKRIGRIDIRDNHTLVELPEGMPADIFQILFEATLADRKLAIKRVKPNRRFRSKDRP